MTEEDTFVARVADLAGKQIQNLATQWSMGVSPADEIFIKASELGLTRTEVPCEFGGLGLGFAAKAATCALLASADFGFAMSVVNTHNVAKRLCISAPASVRDHYLPGLLAGKLKACTALTEPATGSDVAAIEMQAKRSGNMWILNGEKTWIVNARHADLAIVFAQTGSHLHHESIAAFLIDLNSPQVERYKIDSAFSQTSMGTGGFCLKNLEVNDNCMLLAPGKAFKSILHELNGARVYVAAMCDAMLAEALRQVSSYGESRKTFGKQLSEHTSWKKIITESSSALSNAESLTAKARLLVNNGDNVQLSAINAKVNSVETAQYHLPRLLHAMGAEGLFPKYCFTRHLAAVQIAGLTDGATGMLRERAEKLSKQTNRK